MTIEGRRLPIGAELVRLGEEDGVSFRCWAPEWPNVTLVLEDGTERERALPMRREARGYASVFVPGIGAGAQYRFRLGDTLHADPASRFQPEGPFGPSEVIDPRAFDWSDRSFAGHAADAHVIYELHVGTFTREGTFAAATARLAYLRALGITTIELMPLADFGGARGWGYDGVNLFAPTRIYGRPDELRAFVNAAHALSLSVILDVVYNHLGPAGNSLFVFAPQYRAERAGNEWGDALNFDGRDSEAVRELFIANARYWIEEFHFDGLRLDATQAIADGSTEHVIAAIARAAREAGGGRPIFLTAENEPQDIRHVAPPAHDGFGLDAMWNDDFHHSARVALTGAIDGYLHDYRGTPQELISALKRGFLFQGQMYPWQRNPRGTPALDVGARHFVHFLTNHDQEANIALGSRLVTQGSAGRLRALTALLLLGPSLPLLFQGQETGTERPWYFFVDHDETLNQAVRAGREKFVTQFARFSRAAIEARLRAPGDVATFEECQLDDSERDLDAPWVRFHRDLLALRRADDVFRLRGDVTLDGAVLGEGAFVLRWLTGDATRERLLLVNLGAAVHFASCAEPLLAPPRAETMWEVAWSSENAAYGGLGAYDRPIARQGIRLAAESATLLHAVPGTLRLDPSPPDRQTKATFEP